jgi:hypothetical protein
MCGPPLLWSFDAKCHWRVNHLHLPKRRRLNPRLEVLLSHFDVCDLHSQATKAALADELVNVKFSCQAWWHDGIFYNKCVSRVSSSHLIVSCLVAHGRQIQFTVCLVCVLRVRSSVRARVNVLLFVWMCVC